MNIAFDISPLITASGAFGDKSGVYRYSYGIIKSLSEFLKLKDKSAKIILFTFNRDLLRYPINPEVLHLIKQPNISFLSKIPKLEDETVKINDLSDFTPLKLIYKVLKYIFGIDIKTMYQNYYASQQFKKYLRYIKKELDKYHIKVIYHSETGFFPLAGFKNVITIFDLTAIIHPELHRVETVDLQTRKLKFSKQYCQGIICISKSTKKDLMKISHFYEKKILIAYPGINETFQLAALIKDKSEALLRDMNMIIKHKQNKIERKKYLLYYGTFEPRKNLVYLVKAFVDLQTEGGISDEYKLVLIGGEGWGGVKNIIRNYIHENFPLKEKNNIIIFDYLSDRFIINLIKQAYAVIYPSLYEGFGLPVLESMVLGTPVICSRTSSLPEVGGQAVFYTNPLDYFDIQTKIKYLIDHPEFAQELSREGIIQSKKFQWDITVNKLYEFFDNL